MTWRPGSGLCWRRTTPCCCSGTGPEGISAFVSLRGNGFDDLRRVANGDAVIRDILRHDGSCAHYGVLSDGDARKDGRSGPDPAILL